MQNCRRVKIANNKIRTKCIFKLNYFIQMKNVEEEFNIYPLDVKIVTYMDYIDAAFPSLKENQSAELKAEREDLRNKMRHKFS